MHVTLTVIAGPHAGTEFSFDRHDTFLVGRSRHAHFQLPEKDRYFSRIHFMMEVNPPHCRLIDMGSHNGTYVNGHRVLSGDLQNGDQIRAGHTILRLTVQAGTEELQATISQPPASKPAPGVLPSVPGYVLERELSRDGVGPLYLGHRHGDNTPVAIRTIIPSLRRRPNSSRIFFASPASWSSWNIAIWSACAIWAPPRIASSSCPSTSPDAIPPRSCSATAPSRSTGCCAGAARSCTR